MTSEWLFIRESASAWCHMFSVCNCDNDDSLVLIWILKQCGEITKILETDLCNIKKLNDLHCVHYDYNFCSNNFDVYICKCSIGATSSNGHNGYCNGWNEAFVWLSMSLSSALCVNGAWLVEAFHRLLSVTHRLCHRQRGTTHTGTTSVITTFCRPYNVRYIITDLMEMPMQS